MRCGRGHLNGAKSTGTARRKLTPTNGQASCRILKYEQGTKERTKCRVSADSSAGINDIAKQSVLSWLTKNARRFHTNDVLTGVALETLGRVRLAQVGARAIGKATHILELMVEYARERKQFGRAIGDFQLVQQMLADSVIELNAARLMVLNAAWELDQGRDARDSISMVKVFAAETLGRIADRGVQVLGAWDIVVSCRLSGSIEIRGSTEFSTEHRRFIARLSPAVS